MDLYTEHQKEKDKTLSVQIGCKRNKGKQIISYLASLSEEITEQDLGEITKKCIKIYEREMKMWRTMIANFLNVYLTYKNVVIIKTVFKDT